MRRTLNALYKEYNRIQGNHPILVGQVFHERICNRLYKERTMKQIVGLLNEFVHDYEKDGCQRNTRYAIRFIFGPLVDFASGKQVASGPLLAVLDFVDEKCVCVMCWDAGNIQKFYEDDIDLEQLHFDFYASVAEARKQYGLPNTWLWEPLVSQIEKSDEIYDAQWNEIDETGQLSPIQGLDAVITGQIAKHMGVSASYILKCMRDGYQSTCFRSGQVGIAYVDADEAVRKISGAVRDSSGAVLPLENGETVHVPNSKTYYFSRRATSWIIQTIEKRSDLSRQQNITHVAVQKAQMAKEQRENLKEQYHATWEQLCTDGRLSPIKGVNAVSKRQAADYLGISEAELQKYIARLKNPLEKLGMYVISSKNIVKDAVSVRRNEDYSYELLLDNGEWTHIPVGKYTFFTASALFLISNVVQREKELNGC